MPRGDLPRIGVSACLLGERVRWDGRHKRDRWIASGLARAAVLVPVCPEVEIGLGVPRPPIRVGSDGRLVVIATGRDLTRRMERYAARRLGHLVVDGWVLKARSPSCGLEGGVFARTLLRLRPDLPVVEETGLAEAEARRRFLAQVREHHRRRTQGGAAVNRWLVKSDPGDYSFADLVRGRRARWEGVKNALALRHLRSMAKGDAVLVYETGKAKAVVGTATVGAAGDAPELRAGAPLASPVPLAALRADPAWRDSPLVRMGRLSVLPVTEAQWNSLRIP